MSRRGADRQAEAIARVVVTVKAPQQGTGPSGLARYMAESNLHEGLEGTRPRPLFTATGDAVDAAAADRLLSDQEGGPRKCDVIHLTLITTQDAFDALGTSEDTRRAAFRAATRSAMSEVERALGVSGLRWAAAIHRNTGEPHVHVAVGRGARLAEGGGSTRIGKLPPDLLPKQAGIEGRANDGLIARSFSAALSTRPKGQGRTHPRAVELAGGGRMLPAAEV